MNSLKENSVKGLRFLERYTKTDMVYLTKGGFWLGLGQIIASGSSFLMSIAFANLLAPEVYGIYKYVLSINSLILITTLTGMDSAVTQAVARGFDGTLTPALKIKMKWGVMGTVASLGIALYYFLQGNMTLAISFCVVAMFAPFTESMDMYNSMLWGKKKFDTQTLYNIVKKIIILISVIPTIFITKNPYLILLVYLLSMTLPSIYFLHKVRKKYESNKNIDPEAIKYGKNLSAVNIITLIMGELDKILVFHYIGALNLAIYSLAVAPTDQIKGLLKNVNSLAMPQFSQRTPEEIKEKIWHKIGVLVVFTTILVIGYILIAPLFFQIFFPKYLASVQYSQILSLSLIPIVIAGFLYTVLESQKATKELYQYNLYSNIFNIILLVPLVYYLGLWGAIISRFATRLFTLMLSIIILKKI